MRIQDETDCHLSRLSRSLMTRTAFGRVLTPAVQAPGIDSRLALLFPFFFLFSAFLLFRVSLSAPRQLTHALFPFLPASFRYHRVSRFFFHGARAFETVEFDLLGLTRELAGNVRVGWDKGQSFCGVHSRFILIWNEKLYEISSINQY